MITEVDPVAYVTLDGSGNGQVALGPPSGTKWAARLATLATSTSVKTPQAFLYRGSASGPLQLVDSTLLGNAASSQKVAGVLYYPGQKIWAKWVGGDPGAIATLQVFGQQGLRSDPFDPALVGEGFAPSNRSITLPTGAGAGTARIVIGPDLPAPLTTYDFSAVMPGATGPFLAVAAILWYIGTAGDSYEYMALIHNSPVTSAAIVFGSVSGTTMQEISPGIPDGSVYRFGNAITGLGFNQLNYINSGAGSLTNQFTWIGGTVNFQDAFVTLNSALNAITPGGTNDYQIDTISQGRGTVLFVASTASVGPFGVKTAVLAAPSTNTYRNNRAFKVTFGGVFATTVAGSFALVELDTGGNVLVTGASRLGPFQLAASQDEEKWITYFTNSSGADASTAMQLYMTPSAGNLTAVHAATYPFTLQIEDIGSATAFSHLPSL